jgi:hypothetical protein
MTINGAHVIDLGVVNQSLLPDPSLRTFPSRDVSE